MNPLKSNEPLGDGRKRRALAESLYCSARGALTGKGFRSPSFEKKLVSRGNEGQLNYLNQVIGFIASVPGYSEHAVNLKSLTRHYHPVHGGDLMPSLVARKVSGKINQWIKFGGEGGIETAFLSTGLEENSNLSGFDLQKGMPKIPEGTSVDVVAFGQIHEMGVFFPCELYGVKLSDDLAKKVGAPSPVYFDLLRDEPGIFRFTVMTQKELGKARRLLYE